MTEEMQLVRERHRVDKIFRFFAGGALAIRHAIVVDTLCGTAQLANVQCLDKRWTSEEPWENRVCFCCEILYWQTVVVKVALRGWIRRRRAARVIQAAFREAYYNPAYAWCKRVNERSYNSFSQHC